MSIVPGVQACLLQAAAKEECGQVLIFPKRFEKSLATVQDVADGFFRYSIGGEVVASKSFHHVRLYRSIGKLYYKYGVKGN